MMNNPVYKHYIPLEPEAATEPLFIRLPPGGTQCPHSGLSRSTLDILIRPQAANGFKPPVKSKLFRQTGTVAKVRLIDYQSLKAYLYSLPDGGVSLEKEGAKEKGEP